jgi:hypothetical protein
MQHRRAARHGFDHHESNGCVAEELHFLTLVDLPDELYARAIDERAHFVFVISFC